MIRKRKKSGNSASDMVHSPREVIKCLRMTRIINKIKRLGGIGDFFRDLKICEDPMIDEN